METIDRIPTSKIQRASKIIQTGAKVGVNYLKYYGTKLSAAEGEAREKLNKANASDIYDGLKNLKGSALKVAQMLSMEKNILPKAYIDKFSLSQFSVPPLSPALVIKTFKTYFGKPPSQIFDSFNSTSIAAASIGQVHLAEKDGKKLAVKIQYPGVSESISSDLTMIKPLAIKMFNIQGKGSDIYFKEVEDKLLDETNYILEVRESIEMARACNKIENIQFPDYYEALSTDRIITMDWMEGQHLSEFALKNKDKAIANKLGQALWDFYMFQIHHLKKFHADPHPGNFLVSQNNKLTVLDFGCIKNIPDEFYIPYFELARRENLEDKDKFTTNLYQLEILRADDSPQEIEFFVAMFHDLLSLFTEPFQNETFDFSNHTFFEKLSDLGEQYSQNTQLRNMNGNRGSRHFIYVNRTFFGLYNLMHQLQADNINIYNYMPRIVR
ncbi:Predicted unusual protein kinase regulating ubiquinone biosynthesis, AarF/ABC1/UbiB family [Saccharicrinis carchari]|uniref:Predicted unusual protein kinase regulating ubiquinone biosynthesis, AarF/ABC1/UbiB family n=1 Tax=Saccharicrinis carchari TaxID=1168039 RepID=A0A521ELD7_SACCC|nr:AarF/UbiB family protein [Saccharicrinis carchari]SMO84736.1 Predicted unusual protein kinase regulating ubiquinone biosynthesis, AarF/ABC1/UbiB family [Saccharicrinis carchari]